MKIKYIFYVLLFFLSSCQQYEGEGGLASIKGVLLEQNINYESISFGEPTIKMGDDVYISYGNNTIVNDKVETSPTGEFEFNYLTTGTYTIFTYSDDSTNADNQIVISKVITISDKKEDVNIGNITVFKQVSADNGNAIIKGSLYQQDINFLLSKSGAQYVLPKTNVFISSVYNNEVVDQVQTTITGEYIFRDITPGTYKIYTYSDDTLVFDAKEKMEQSQIITVSEPSEIITVNDIIVYNHADVDDGEVSVYGYVYQVQYINNTTVAYDTIVAQDENVFLMYENSSFVSLDSETSHNGMYAFHGLIPGNYKVYAFSEKLNSSEDDAIIVEFEVTDETTVIYLDKIYIGNY